MVLGDYKDVWVFIEFYNGVIDKEAYELINIGKQLAVSSKERLCAVIIQNNSIDEDLSDLIKYGCDYVYAIENNFSIFEEDIFVEILTDFCNENKPNIFLFNGSLLGRSLAPQIAYKLRTGLTADCTELRMDSKDNKILIQKRPAFNGNLYAEIVCKSTRPQMATVKKGIVRELDKDDKRIGKIIRFNKKYTDKSIFKILETSSIEGARCNSLEKSNIVIGVGRGVKDKRVYSYIEEFATLVNAEIGFTRPALENEWANSDNLIGQTGKSLKCKIYIAFGISGTLQHIAGIINCDMIIAVNNDRNSNIFNYATYGIVGDVEIIIKNLIENFR